MDDARTLQTADFSISVRPFALKARVAVTTGGLLAVAVLVTGILCATAVLVAAAKRS